MTALSPEFKKNLESAILDHGRFACPNIECTDWITSKEFIKNDGSKFLEYHCTNSECTFHQKEIIPIENEAPELASLSLIFSKKKKRWLAGAASILLILTVALGNYIPKLTTDNSANITPKEMPTTVVKKRTIVLSQPVFKDNTESQH